MRIDGADYCATPGLGTIWRIWGGGAGGLALAAAVDGVGLGNKKPGPWPGLLLGAAGLLVATLVVILVYKAELGPFVEDVERGLEFLEVGTLAGCAADLLA